MLMRKTILIIILVLASHTVLADEIQKEHSKHHNNEEIISLSADIVKRYHIKLDTGSSQIIYITRDILGKIVPNANKTLYIYPRYSGIIKKMTKYLGDKVKKDELLARVESNQTLQTYAINAPFSGYIVKKRANLGEFVKTDSPLYQLADLSSVWVHLFVYRKNARLIKKGQTIFVFNDRIPGKKIKSVIDYVSPLGIEHSQTMMARAILQNDVDKLTWLPGLYVDVKVVIDVKTVPVAVKNTAIQTVDDQHVVFVKTTDGFKPEACKLGIRGEAWTEILSGLNAGDVYVSENSFILKAELEKESAQHRH